jgi:peptide-methionine (S)-S-oxide reductase
MAFILQSLAKAFNLPTGAQLLPPTTAMTSPAGSQTAIFAAGCFWGVEHMFRKQFSPAETGGLYDARVGYIGGATSSPGYRAVCSGETGHAEAVKLTYNPEKVSFKELCEFFFKMHDPTTKDRQGPDRGSQYRSGIFYVDDEQKKVAEDIKEKVGKKWWTKGTVVTEVIKAGQWWDAETYHQLYLDKNPGGYECPSHYLRKFPPLD